MDSFPISSKGRVPSISSSISSIFSHRNIAIRVARKSGMPLNSGEAAMWRRICIRPPTVPFLSALLRTSSFNTSSFQSRLSGSWGDSTMLCSDSEQSFPNALLISAKIQGLPNVARPTMIPSTPVSSKRRLAISPEVTSPFPITGILMRGLAFTLRIGSQLASPLYTCERVRP